MAPGAPAGERPATDEVLSGANLAGRVVRGGAARIAGVAVANLLIAGSTVLLLRHLGVTAFGRYGTVMALMTIVGGVTDAGLNIVGTRELALVAPGASRQAMTSAILGIRLLLASAGVAVAVVFAAVAGYDTTMVAGTAVAGVGAIGIAAQAALCLPAQVALRNAAIGVIEVTKAAIQTVGTAALVVLGAALLPFFAVQAAVGVGIVVALPLILGRGVLLRPRRDAAEWRRVMRAALPVAIAGVLAILYLRIVVVLGSLLVDDVQTGLLVTSTRIVEVVAQLPLLFVGVILPVATVAARDDPARLRYVAGRMLETGVLLGALAALGLGFGAHTAVIVLGGHAYADAAAVLSIHALTLITVWIVQACVVVLVATHHQAAIARANLAGLAAIIVAALILLPIDGARGGAIAAVVADAGLAALMLLAVRRAGVRLTLGLVPRIALAAAVGVAAGLIPGLGDLAAALAAMGAFLVACLALRAVPSEILDATLARFR